jgi:hypothetical protein
MIESINLALGIIGVIGFIVATLSLIEIKALKQSTHKIEWRPLDEPKSGLDDKLPPIDNNTDELSFDDVELFGDDIELFMDGPPIKKKPKEK